VTQPIVYVDTSTIKPGRLGELEIAMQRLAAFVERNMPRVASYGFYLNEARTTMTVVAVHPDSESLAVHLERGREEFRRFAEMIELVRIDVYGAVSRAVVEALHAKAEMLGTGTLIVHRLSAGFSR